MSAALMRRTLPDGRILELWQMLFNYRITITEPQNDGVSHEDVWCYKRERLAEAARAFEAWQGDGDDGPPGWNKHPTTGRWREDGTGATEINQWAP